MVIPHSSLESRARGLRFHNISHFPSKTPFLKAAVSLPSPSPLCLSLSLILRLTRVVSSSPPQQPLTEAIPGTHCSLVFNQNGQRPKKGERETPLTFADARSGMSGLHVKNALRIHCGLSVSMRPSRLPHTFDNDHELGQII